MDSHIGEPERPVQNRLLALFKEKLKYEYLGNYEYRTCNRNIERKLLFDYLMSTKKWSGDEAKRAIAILEKEAYCTPQNMRRKGLFLLQNKFKPQLHNTYFSNNGVIAI